VATDRTLAAKTSLVLDALGDGTRRAIVDLLAERPRAVVELAAALPVTRPAVSLHLRVLRDAGLVRDRAVGTRRIYQLDREGLAMLREYLDLVWASALDRFAAAAEAAHAADVARGKRSPARRAGSDHPRSSPKRRH
jgi:DNA-binding transcriptional ArsR family regulator